MHATRTNPYGLLILCEVAVGTPYKLKRDKYMLAPPETCHSTLGLGKNVPSSEEAM